MIISGGENLVDLVPDSSTVDGELGALVPRLGGGPYNVALTAGRLGVPSGYLSRMSTDRFGEALLDRLRKSDVDTSLVQRSELPTTLAVVALGDDGSARYTFYTEGTADRAVTDPGPLPAEASVLSVGTLGMVLEPGASAYEAVLRREAGRGVLTALDPNIRADLITDPAAYRERFASWLPHVGLLKVSVEDAEWLADGRGLDDAVASWLAAGAGAVVLTSGGDGLSVRTAAGLATGVPSAPARVVDTIGAGDTAHGALLAWLHGRDVRGAEGLGRLGEDDWREGLGYAARAAAITVSRSGAEPPTAAELGPAAGNR